MLIQMQFGAYEYVNRQLAACDITLQWWPNTQLANMFCVTLLSQQSLKLIESCRLIFNVCFIVSVFTRVRKVSYQGICTI